MNKIANQLAQMRQNYTQQGLRKNDVDEDPMVQFKNWLDEAIRDDLPEWMEANAMTLSTADLDGHVTSRIVLLKGLQDNKFWFYTNYDSDKAVQMKTNARVALCFFWPYLERQVRVAGTVEKSTRSQSESYFQQRPRDSQLGALVSEQSRVVQSRDDLESAFKKANEQYRDEAIPCPANWGGYGVAPEQIEFWQGRSGRLHDRIQYSLRDGNWVLERLSP